MAGAWSGSSGWGSSSEALMLRVEANDPTLRDLVILPTKAWSASQVDRLATALAHGTNTHLCAIHASGHAVPPESLRSLGQAIAHCGHRIQHLAVGDVTMGDAGAQALLDGLTDNGVTSAYAESKSHALLDLSYKGLGPASFCRLVHFCERENHPWSRWCLARNVGLLTSPVGNDIPHAAVLLQRLHELDLSDCDLDEDQCVSLFALDTTSGASTLRSCRLSHNPRIGPRGARAVWHFLLSSSSSSPRLHQEPEPQYGYTNNIQELYLNNCGITDDGMRGLADGSRDERAQCPLRILDVSENQLTSASASSLVHVLSPSCGNPDAHVPFPDLIELNVSQNPLREGVLVLVHQGLVPRHTHSLASPHGATRLQSLDLSATHCTVPGAHAALSSSHVTTLRLFDNRLGRGPDGWNALDLRTAAPELEMLDLAGNGADQAAVVRLLQVLVDDTDPDTLILPLLKTLVVGGNQGGTDLEDLCAQIRKVRPDLDIARDKIRKR
jgi:hypothetical protein